MEYERRWWLGGGGGEGGGLMENAKSIITFDGYTAGT